MQVLLPLIISATYAAKLKNVTLKNMDFDDIVTFLLGGAIVVLVVSVIVVSILTTMKVGEYEENCRASGGTPVHTHRAVNCAQEGFIDIRI